MMANLAMTIEWSFSLGGDELALTERALRGDLDAEAIAKARALGDALSAERVAAMRDALRAEVKAAGMTLTLVPSGRKAGAEVNAAWRLSVSSAEIMLITRALRCDLGPDDGAKAVHLADWLAENREKSIKLTNVRNEKLAENVARAQRPGARR